MSINLGFLMDPIELINTTKDTSFAMMLEAQHRGYTIFYFQQTDLWLQDGLTWAKMQKINICDQAENYYHVEDTITQPLVELDILIMRKDPPFNMNFVYTTYLLEQAEAKGVKVINRPSSLRDANEKLFAMWFPQCCPKTIVSAKKSVLLDFAEDEQDIVIKPLGGMGGHAIFHLHADDPNLQVAIETLTKDETELVMAQRFIPEITAGDKRIILINGTPIPYALARIPKAGDFRGNLAKGASAEGRELTDRDLWLCEQVGPTLREKGLVFVGLDVIGDYLTEINVTSPTGVRELDRMFNLNICAELFDVIV